MITPTQREALQFLSIQLLLFEGRLIRLVIQYMNIEGDLYGFCIRSKGNKHLLLLLNFLHGHPRRNFFYPGGGERG